MSDDDDDSFEMSDDEELGVGTVGAVAGPPPITEDSAPEVEAVKEEPQDLPEEDKAEDPPPKEASPVSEESVQSPQQSPASDHSEPPPKETAIPLSTLTAPRPSVKPKKEQRLTLQSATSMPVLTTLTTNAMTYDLDLLLDPKVQKKATGADRLTQTQTSDFIRRNRESAGKPRNSSSRDEGSRPRTSYRDPVNVEERFYKYRKNVEEKVKAMEHEMRKKEKELCTFKPAIIGKRNQSEGSRSCEDFYQEMMRHKHGIDEKVKFLRDESSKAQKSQEESYFRPQLCEKSKRMVSGKGEPELPVHEKLYQAHRLNMQRQLKSVEATSEASVSSVSVTTQDSAKPFMPVINRMSQNLIRDKPIEQHLLEDAERRLKKSESAQSKPSAPKLISGNSEQLLLKKFKEEVEQVWEQLDAAHTGTLNYIKIGELLKSLYFIENESQGKHYEEERALVRSMWSLMRLTEDSGISRANLETLLLAVMNFPVPESSPAEKVSDTDSRHDALSESSIAVGRMEDGVFLLAPGDAKRIHFHFKSWYERRIAKLNRSNKNPLNKEEVKYSYRPEISRNSRKLTQGNAGRRSASGFARLEDYLISESARKKERQKELQEKAAAEAMRECVFKPRTDRHSSKLVASLEEPRSDTLSSEYLKIIKQTSPKPKDKTTALYNLATLSQQRRKKLEKSPEDMDIEQNEVQCSFAPDLRRTRNYVSGMGDFSDRPKGVDKAVERIVKARQEADLIKALRESGLSYRGKKEKQLTESRTEGPLVVLAVQVSGRAEELRVRPGDDLDALIAAFATQHRLTSSETALVQEQLRSQYEQATGAATDD